MPQQESNMKIATMEGLLYVPEEHIRYAAEIERVDNPNNTFDKLLKSANKFREANLTPMFFYDEDEMHLYVTTKEKMEKKYH
jgi:hypothetical protein